MIAVQEVKLRLAAHLLPDEELTDEQLEQVADRWLEKHTRLLLPLRQQAKKALVLREADPASTKAAISLLEWAESHPSMNCLMTSCPQLSDLIVKGSGVHTDDSLEALHTLIELLPSTVGGVRVGSGDVAYLRTMFTGLELAPKGKVPEVSDEQVAAYFANHAADFKRLAHIASKALAESVAGNVYEARLLFTFELTDPDTPGGVALMRRIPSLLDYAEAALGWYPATFEYTMRLFIALPLDPTP